MSLDKSPHMTVTLMFEEEAQFRQFEGLHGQKHDRHWIADFAAKQGVLTLPPLDSLLLLGDEHEFEIVCVGKKHSAATEKATERSRIAAQAIAPVSAVVGAVAGGAAAGAGGPLGVVAAAAAAGASVYAAAEPYAQHVARAVRSLHGMHVTTCKKCGEDYHTTKKPGEEDYGVCQTCRTGPPDDAFGTNLSRILPVAGSAKVLSASFGGFVNCQVEVVALTPVHNKDGELPAGSVFMTYNVGDKQATKWIQPHALNSSFEIAAGDCGQKGRVLSITGPVEVFSQQLNSFVNCNVAGIALGGTDDLPAGSLLVKSAKLSKWIPPNLLSSTLKEFVPSPEPIHPTVASQDQEPCILPITGPAKIYSKTLREFTNGLVEGIALGDFQDGHNSIPVGSVHVKYINGQQQLTKWIPPSDMAKIILSSDARNSSGATVEVPWILPVTGIAKIHSPRQNAFVDCQVAGVALRDKDGAIPVGSVLTNCDRGAKWIPPEFLKKSVLQKR